MTPDQFKSWRHHMQFSQREASEALGVSKGSVELYEHGARRDDGRAVVIPKTIELACAAIALGVKYYDGPQQG